MTSVVKVTAHCGKDKKVTVRVLDFPTSTVIESKELEDGESCEYYIYDNRQVRTMEAPKEQKSLGKKKAP